MGWWPRAAAAPRGSCCLTAHRRRRLRQVPGHRAVGGQRCEWVGGWPSPDPSPDPLLTLSWGPEGSGSTAQGGCTPSCLGSELLLSCCSQDCDSPSRDPSPSVVRVRGSVHTCWSRAGVEARRRTSVSLSLWRPLGQWDGEQGWEAGGSPRAAAPQAARMAPSPSPAPIALPPSLQSTTKKMDVTQRPLCGLPGHQRLFHCQVRVWACEVGRGPGRRDAAGALTVLGWEH